MSLILKFRMVMLHFVLVAFFANSCKAPISQSNSALMGATNPTFAGCERALDGGANRSKTTVSIEKPLLQQVFQRDERNGATVPVAGTVRGSADCVEVRVVSISNAGTEIVGWTKITDKSGIAWWWGTFKGSVRVPAGGWYSLSTRAWTNHQAGKETVLERFGVGEVFVAAGQSNSTNYGTSKQVPHDNRIVAFDGQHWNFAADPQPLATTDGSRNGSPWPPMADLLIAKWQVPVGIVSVGWGGTSVTKWQPGGSLYPRLKSALNVLGVSGVRAVLWHQGEADGILGLSTATYQGQLESLIAQSRRDAGYDVKWFVARAAYIPATAQKNRDDIREAQRRVVDNRLTFQGPDTDSMGDEFRSPEDHVHMNDAGLKEHGRRWATAILEYIP